MNNFDQKISTLENENFRLKQEYHDLHVTVSRLESKIDDLERKISAIELHLR